MTERETIRLQKYLAERGVASRRHSAELIKAGRVRVNGNVVTEPGLHVDIATVCVEIDGHPVSSQPESTRTIVLNKPRGYVCSTRGQNSKTVYELIPEIKERLVPAGRLDKDSEGLLIMSNDGDLIHRLTHPRFGHTKTYHVTVSGQLDDKVLERLRRPITIEGYETKPAIVRILRSQLPRDRKVLEITLEEGRNQQIRRLCKAAGLRVHRLMRTRIGSVEIQGLKPSAWRDIAQ